MMTDFNYIDWDECNKRFNFMFVNTISRIGHCSCELCCPLHNLPAALVHNSTKQYQADRGTTLPTGVKFTKKVGRGILIFTHLFALKWLNHYNLTRLNKPNPICLFAN